MPIWPPYTGLEGRFAEAEAAATGGHLRCGEKALDPEHQDIGITLNNLAQLYSNYGRFDDAEPLLKRSLLIFEKARGSEHPDALNLF